MYPVVKKKRKILTGLNGRNLNSDHFWFTRLPLYFDKSRKTKEGAKNSTP